MPVLLLTGVEAPTPKAQVGAVAAALPDVRLLVLPGQQHIADTLDPATFALHLLGFLHRPTLSRAPIACLSRATSLGHSEVGPAPITAHGLYLSTPAAEM